MKTTSKGRQPPMEEDLKEYLSDHWSDLPQILNLWFGDQNQSHKYLKERYTLVKADLKILKVEYLSNHWLDFPQISNFSLGDQTKIKSGQNKDNLKWKMTTNGRRPPMENNLKIFKIEYFRNHWLDLPRILNWSLVNWMKITNAWKEDNHQWKKTSNY